MDNKQKICLIIGIVTFMIVFITTGLINTDISVTQTKTLIDIEVRDNGRVETILYEIVPRPLAEIVWIQIAVALFGIMMGAIMGGVCLLWTL